MKAAVEIDPTWTPEAVKTVARALLGTAWQKRLADAIQHASGRKFEPVRVRHWYLESNSRPIPEWVDRELTDVFLAALEAHDDERDVAAREIRKRTGRRC